MTVFCFFLGLAQCFFLLILARSGINMLNRAIKEREKAAYEPAGGWPLCELIIPVAGQHPQMEKALRSLLEQDYPNYSVILVTETDDEKAGDLARMLAEEYPDARHITADKSDTCGQKNFNLLAGIDHAKKDSQVYAFCDSTHLAREDFLRCLITPIARKEAEFCTGYHQVQPRDNRLVDLAYAASVLFMGLMQGMPSFTQPWGGALAMRRAAFEKRHVRQLWETNVVDDCSLAALLKKDEVAVHMCSAAVLETVAKGCSLSTWRAWMERQILFLKFCIPGQWLGLGIFCIFMLVPPIWATLSFCGGILGIGGGMAPFLAFFWLLVTSWAISFLRTFLNRELPQMKWILAFFTACAMFGVVYAQTILANSITWRNTVYRVGSNGKVQAVERG